MNWYFRAWKKCIDYSGRARRKEFWYFHLVSLAIVLLLLYIDVANDMYSRSMKIGALSGALVSALAGISVTVRRLHDMERSGWWYLANFIPYAGPVLLLFFCSVDGDPHKKPIRRFAEIWELLTRILR